MACRLLCFHVDGRVGSEREMHWRSGAMSCASRVADWRMGLRAKGRAHRYTLRRLIDGFVLLLLCIGVGAYVAKHALSRAPIAPGDLLRDARWKASSTYEAYLAPAMFFHTQEEASPNLTYELPAPTTFSSLVVQNSDVYRERAVPLVAEISTDGHDFHEVARINAVFVTWRPQFPGQVARYLRLRVLRRTWLHLKHVQAYR
jgi:hypothetical protein